MRKANFVCCAIPLVHKGIYFITAEMFALSVVLIALAFALPSIVGSTTGTWGHVLIAIVALMLMFNQLLGFWSIYGGRKFWFRRYWILNAALVSLMTILAVVCIALSAAQHNKAMQACISTYFADATSDSQSTDLCRIFTWLDVGLMGLLVLLLALVHAYFVFLQWTYWTSFASDEVEYWSIKPEAQPEPDSLSHDPEAYVPTYHSYTQPLPPQPHYDTLETHPSQPIDRAYSPGQPTEYHEAFAPTTYHEEPQSRPQSHMSFRAT